MKNRELHGDYGTRLFHTYNNMKQRCNNPNFKQYADYGGRGIWVCGIWNRSYISFKKWAIANGYREHLTLDRIKNDKGYSPDNCQWATHTEQKLNTRTRKDNTSGYKGVSFRKDTGKFTSYVNIHHKRKVLGCFSTANEALNARNNYIIENNTGHEVQDVKEK